MRFKNEIRQHFSIRKLSVGAASVLIGISFLGAGAQTVNADINNDTKPQEVIETNHKTAAAPVEKQAEAPGGQPVASAVPWFEQLGH